MFPGMLSIHMCLSILVLSFFVKGFVPSKEIGSRFIGWFGLHQKSWLPALIPPPSIFLVQSLIDQNDRLINQFLLLPAPRVSVPYPFSRKPSKPFFLIDPCWRLTHRCMAFLSPLPLGPVGWWRGVC